MNQKEINEMNVKLFCENYPPEDPLGLAKLNVRLKQYRLNLIRDSITHYETMLNNERKKLCSAMADYNESLLELEEVHKKHEKDKIQ